MEGHEDIFGWYWGAEGGAAFTSPAHKAWLALDAGTEGSGEDARARSFISLPDEDNESTGIKTTDFTDYTDKAGAWYTLDGRKLDKQPTAKGLYIYGSKKVMIK